MCNSEYTPHLWVLAAVPARVSQSPSQVESVLAGFLFSQVLEVSDEDSTLLARGCPLTCNLKNLFLLCLKGQAINVNGKLYLFIAGLATYLPGFGEGWVVLAVFLQSEFWRETITKMLGGGLLENISFRLNPKQCFSVFNVIGISALLKCRFWFHRSELGPEKLSF